MHPKAKRLTNQHKLFVVVFISGFVVMSIEIAGSRILAPFIGTSIIAWTSLIGIVLACLSLGYYLGGKMADKYPRNLILSLIMAAAAAYLFTTGITNIAILTYIRSIAEDIMILSLASSFFLFGPPTVLLGMVAPFAFKLSLNSVNKTGRVSGNLYAISTIGSILGTFVTGFYLISIIGSSKIILISSLLLLFTSLLLISGREVARGIATLFIAVLIILSYFASKHKTQGLGIYDQDSKYSRIIVGEKSFGDDKRQGLILVNGKYIDGFFNQSGVYLDDKDELIPGYTRYFRLINHFIKDPQNVLMLGGGGYTYVRDFLRNNPESSIDVVEIDPEMTSVAKQFFGLEEDPRLNIYHEDGRAFLDRCNKEYDVIILDVYSGDSSIPFHLTTTEFIGKARNLLREDGLFLANIASAVEGEKSKFLQAEFKTVKEHFAQVYTIPLREDLSVPQNIILLATNRKELMSFQSANKEYSDYLSGLYLGEIASGVPILTDEYAPIEHYLYERIK